jgi:hypothetical protein
MMLRPLRLMLRVVSHSSMLPLSAGEPEYEPHAACQSTSMNFKLKLAAQYMLSPLRLMHAPGRVAGDSSMFPLTVSDPE